jgi:hypothetical protein
MNGSYQRLMLMPQKTPQGLKAKAQLNFEIFLARLNPRSFKTTASGKTISETA